MAEFEQIHQQQQVPETVNYLYEALRPPSVAQDTVGEGQSSGGAERESRFITLLQPNRDLATNWTVDVVTHLESYLAELSITGLFNDGQSSLNFAEAALLIQGSTQVYSRKVEYLYALVLQALDFITQNKQGHGDVSSEQADAQHDDAVEEKEEEFLNLDDITEEANIDIFYEDVVESIYSAQKLPASLLAVEAEPIEISGQAGELATYEISMSIMHRTFLLLDPCDIETVDKYLDGDDPTVQHGKGPATLGRAPPVRTPRIICGTPDQVSVSAQTWGVNVTPFGGTNEDGDDTEPEPDRQGNEGTTWDYPLANEYQMNDGLKDQWECEYSGAAKKRQNVTEKDGFADPWIPLNPHDYGDLPVKPFRKGERHKRKRAPRRKRGATVSSATRTGVYFPEFVRTVQAHERLNRAERRQAGLDDSPFEDFRSSFPFSDAGSAADVLMDIREGSERSGEYDQMKNENWEDSYDMADNCDHDSANATEQSHPTSPFQQPRSECQSRLSPRQDVPFLEEGDEETILEEPYQPHPDPMLRKMPHSHVRTSLPNSITSWKNKIQAALIEQDSRPPFDIHQYGDQLLEKLSTLAERSGEDEDDVHESFTYLVGGQHEDQVAKSFSALLQLVNNGKVVIDKGDLGIESYCFTGENPFSVKLLTSHTRHKGVFENMISTKAGEASDRSGTPQIQAPSTPQLSRIRQDTARFASKTSTASNSRSRGFTVLSTSPPPAMTSCHKRGQRIAGKLSIPNNKENWELSTSLQSTSVKLTPKLRQWRKTNPLQRIVL